MGVLLHDPLLVVSVLPGAAVPVTTGSVAFCGAAGGGGGGGAVVVVVGGAVVVGGGVVVGGAVVVDAGVVVGGGAVVVVGGGAEVVVVVCGVDVEGVVIVAQLRWGECELQGGSEWAISVAEKTPPTASSKNMAAVAN